MLFCICILSVSAKCQFSSSSDSNDPGVVGGDPDQEDATQVPFGDYVPFMVAGIIVYGIYVNRQKRAVQMQ